jgi:protein TonB
MNRSLNLKRFIYISIGLHFLFLLVLTFLYPDFKISYIPPLHIEVTLFPLVPETIAAPNPIAKPKPEIKKHELPIQTELPDLGPHSEELVRRTDVQTQIVIQEQRDWPQEEKKEEEPLIKEEQKNESFPIQFEVKVNIPTIEPQPAIPENKKLEIENLKEKKTIEEFYENHIPKTASSDNPKIATVNPSLSDEEALFVPAKLVREPKLIYPEEARQKGYGGKVLLRIEILPNGKVGKVEVKKSSGYEILDQAAIAFGKEHEFSPAKKGGTPVSDWVGRPVRFDLKEGKTVVTIMGRSK